MGVAYRSMRSACLFLVDTSGRMARHWPALPAFLDALIAEERQLEGVCALRMLSTRENERTWVAAPEDTGASLLARTGFAAGPRLVLADPVSGLRAALSEPWAGGLDSLDAVVVGDFDTRGDVPTTRWTRARPLVSRHLLPVTAPAAGPAFQAALLAAARLGWRWSPDWLERRRSARTARDLTHALPSAPFGATEPKRL